MKKYLLLAKYNISLIGLYHALVQEREIMLFSISKEEMESHQEKINLIEAEIKEYQQLKETIKNK